MKGEDGYWTVTVFIVERGEVFCSSSGSCQYGEESSQISQKGRKERREMKTYVGIDPGKTGAVAVLMGIGLVCFYDAEMIELEQLGAAIGKDSFVLLERPMVMPGSKQRRLAAGVAAGEPGVEKEVGQGRIGILNYGIGYGEYRGMLKTLRIPFSEIHPMTWKKEFSLIHQDKQRSIDVAKHLFPSAADRLILKKHHGRAEALLIAEYARRKNM